MTLGPAQSRVESSTVWTLWVPKAGLYMADPRICSESLPVETGWSEQLDLPTVLSNDQV